MTIRLGDLENDWLFAEGDSEILFPGRAKRTVRLDVRTEVRCALFVVFNDEKPRFLTTVDGLETVEFTAPGPFTLYGEGPIHVRTADATYVGFPNTDEETFTKVFDRRPVSPEMEAIRLLIHKNKQEMRAQLARDYEGMKRSLEKEYARREALDKARGASTVVGAEPDDQRSAPGEASGKTAESKEPSKGSSEKK